MAYVRSPYEIQLPNLIIFLQMEVSCVVVQRKIGTLSPNRVFHCRRDIRSRNASCGLDAHLGVDRGRLTEAVLKAAAGVLPDDVTFDISRSILAGPTCYSKGERYKC